MGAALYSVLLYATLAWSPAHFMRFHGMQSGELGTVLALIIGVAGGVGTFSAGLLADALTRRYKDLRWSLRVPAYSFRPISFR